MKIKKEYLILFIIIAALVLYISLRQGNRIQYDIPELPKLDQEKIAGIEMKTKDKDISIMREGEKWLIGKEKYTALKHTIEDMLNFLEKPVLMTVISDSKNYKRYGLDEESSLIVNAVNAGGMQRKIEIGLRGAGQRYTFIKLENDHRVFSVKEDLRDIFILDIDKLRDKKVVSFDVDEVKGIHLVTMDKTFTAVRKEDEGEKKVSGDTKPENKYIWQSSNEKELDGTEVAGILSEISTLRCLSYYYDMNKEDFKDPLYTITVNGKKDYRLRVYKKGEDESDYPVISSESPNPFKVSMWKIDNIIDDFKKLYPEEDREERIE